MSQSSGATTTDLYAAGFRSPLISKFNIVRARNSEADPSQFPAPRSGHRMFVTPDYIYLLGGYSSAPETRHKTFTDVWRFNLVNDLWEQCKISKGSIPDTLASFSLIQTDNYNEAYVFGGTGVPFGARASDKLYKINVTNSGDFVLEEEKVVGDEKDKPPRMYGQGMIYRRHLDSDYVTETIYLMGGTTGHEYNMDVWKLECITPRRNLDECDIYHAKEWKSTCLTDGRYRLEAVLHQNLLISFGGGAPDFCADFEQLLCFDVQKEKFVKVPTIPDDVHGFPGARKCHAMIEFGNDVYIIGGCCDLQNSEVNREIYEDVWKIDLNTMQWTKLPARLPSPVYFHSASVTIEGCVHVFGGCTDIASKRRTNQLQAMWLKPPTLLHLSMKTVLNRLSDEEASKEITMRRPMPLIRKVLYSL
ncbi:kelch motif domain-containing protein [Ditylenchus destructor]|uniref:Kelch domain-containing protein 10 n=1 Tax=Ditylenchus destructor TaxID=166010 RepID=A0AAD4NED7_9BILA|nr:kelch motif domain-containing protein [Ditylenchus destructor]